MAPFAMLSWHLNWNVPKWSCSALCLIHFLRVLSRDEISTVVWWCEKFATSTRRSSGCRCSAVSRWFLIPSSVAAEHRGSRVTVTGWSRTASPHNGKPRFSGLSNPKKKAFGHRVRGKGKGAGGTGWREQKRYNFTAEHARSVPRNVQERISHLRE